MINPLSKLPSTARKALQSLALHAGSESGPVDQVSLETQKRYREPEQAIDFMKAFNEQLGIGEEAKRQKQQLMAEDSHSFFRASPALFYHDLKTVYSERSKLLDGAPTLPIVGDAHALNAGTFRGPEGDVVWGLNDFDQADLGSPEWDLARLGTSLYIAARSDGRSAEQACDLVRDFGKSYLDSLDESGPSYLTRKESKGEVEELIEKKSKVSQNDLLEKWAESGRKSLKKGDKLVEPDPQRGAEVQNALKETFPELHFLDLASKPESGGSTRGLERYYALVEAQDRPDPWLLEVKAVLPSPVQNPDGDLSRGDGAQVLEYQKQMGGHTDGRHRSFKVGDIAFFTREREKEKGSLDDDKKDHREDTAEQIGKVLARAHNAAGADLKGWVKDREETLMENLVGFSQTYARQVESDFRAWRERYAPAGADT